VWAAGTLPVGDQGACRYFQVLSITIWLVDERKAGCGWRSTSNIGNQWPDLTLPQADARDNPRPANHPDPVDMIPPADCGGHAAKSSGFFRKGGHRICVPVIATGRSWLLPWAIGWAVWSSPCKNFDLLKCIAPGRRQPAQLQLSQNSSKPRNWKAFKRCRVLRA